MATAPTRPTNLQLPFAATGSKATIPNTATGTNAASYPTGFPPVTMLPISGGGIPPKGVDFNGVLYDVSSHTLWVNAGGQYLFDSTLSTAMGGYPAGMVLQSNDGRSSYVSTINNNTTDFNSTPASIGTSWIPWAGDSQSELALTTTGGTTTLTSTQAANKRLRISGTLVSNAIVTVPARLGNWEVSNATTGAFTLTIKTPSGTGVAVSQGVSDQVFCDATNVLFANIDTITQSLSDSTDKQASTKFCQLLLASLIPPTSKWRNVDIVTATGNYTVKAAVSLLRVYAIGQGGNGAGTGFSSGGGGGGCAYGELTVTPAQVIACTINSTNTLFGSDFTGNAGVTATTTTGGTGGTASKSGSVANGGTSTGGAGANGASGGAGGGGGASGSPLGVGGAGGAGGGSGGDASGGGGGGWATAGGNGAATAAATGGNGGGATNLSGRSRDVVSMYTDPLLTPCSAESPPTLIISGANLSFTANGGPGAGGLGALGSGIPTTPQNGGAGGQGGGGGGGYGGINASSVTATNGGVGGLGGGGGGGGRTASVGKGNGANGGYGGGGGGSDNGTPGTGGAGIIIVFY